MTPMKEYEYMCLCLDLIPDEIVQCYNLHEPVDDQGWVYVKIQMGMYGLPQARILANKLLEQCLNAKGYYHCQHTPGLWRHIWRDIIFCLVVDNFDIKTTSCKHDSISRLPSKNTTPLQWTGMAPFLQHQHQVELSSRHRQPQHAKIYSKGTTKIPTPNN
jgi:hypothetical protein